MRFLLLLLALLPLHAFAQAYPSKPVRVIVPLPPGPLDGTIRVIQPRIQEELGQPLVIENRPGASGAIALEAVARAAPDGYTVLAGAGGHFIVAPLLVPKHPTDPLRDLAPVTAIYDAPQAVVVKPSVPAETLQQLIDYAKRNPGKLTYGSSGTGGAAHMDGENFKRVTGVDLLHVPYKGYGPMVQALLGGEVDMLASVSLAFVRPLVAAGKLRLVAVHNGKAPDMPVPNLEEVLPGFSSVPIFVGFLTTAGTPRPNVLRLQSATVKAMASPELRKKFESQGYTVIANTPEEFGAMIRAAYERTARMVKALKDSGVKLD